MEMFVISGGRPLEGCVSISGAKNAALPIMAATILADDPVTLHNIPQLADVATLARLLVSLGLEIQGDASGALHFQTVDEAPYRAGYHLVRRMREVVPAYNGGSSRIDQFGGGGLRKACQDRLAYAVDHQQLKLRVSPHKKRFSIMLVNRYHIKDYSKFSLAAEIEIHSWLFFGACT